MNKKNRPVIKLYCFSDTSPEWLSIKGNKYAKALPFEWKMVDQFQEADVIAWDGMMTPKSDPYLEKLLEHLKSGKMLILMRKSESLHQKNPFVELIKTENLNVIDLPGMNILPEDLLKALETCYQKITHV